MPFDKDVKTQSLKAGFNTSTTHNRNLDKIKILKDKGSSSSLFEMEKKLTTMLSLRSGNTISKDFKNMKSSRRSLIKGKSNETNMVLKSTNPTKVVERSNRKYMFGQESYKLENK